MPRRFKQLSLVLLLLVVFFLLWPRVYLIAQTDETVLFAWPIKARESFEVTFLHSLNLSPITDIIEWTGKELIVRKSIFKTFGAGVPIPADGIGKELLHIDDHYELIGIDKELQNFTIMTQEVPNHTIKLNGCEASLLELAGSGKLVHITVKRLSPVYYFWSINTVLR